MPIDYSKWDNIEVSDDEEFIENRHIEKGCLARLRHQQRLEKMVLAKKERLAVNKELSEAERNVSELQAQLKNQNEKSDDRQKLDQQLTEAEAQHQHWLMKERELNELASKVPLNVDTICHTVKESTRISDEPVRTFNPDEDICNMPSSDIEDFLKENEANLLQLVTLESVEETIAFLKDRPMLCKTMTRDVLLVLAVDQLMLGDKKKSCSAVVQNLRISWLIEQAAESGVASILPSFIEASLSKLAELVNENPEPFVNEMKQVQKVVKMRAAMREKEKAVQEVLDSLPPLMRESFITRDKEKLIEAGMRMDQEEFDMHMERCKKVGLWNSSTSDAASSIKEAPPATEGTINEEASDVGCNELK